MEDLKILLDENPIAEINEQVSRFVHSADGYDNKLKLAFVLLNLIKEAAQLLGQIDCEEFLSEIRKRVADLNEQSKSLSDAYHAQMLQNKEVVELLSDNTNNRISEINGQIEVLLKEYDTIIKQLINIREQLPIEKQLTKESKIR